MADTPTASEPERGWTACCKHCGKLAIIHAGRVNEVLNVSVTPRCECGAGFNVWTPLSTPELDQIEIVAKLNVADNAVLRFLEQLDAAVDRFVESYPQTADANETEQVEQKGQRRAYAAFNRSWRDVSTVNLRDDQVIDYLAKNPDESLSLLPE